MAGTPCEHYRGVPAGAVKTLWLPSGMMGRSVTARVAEAALATLAGLEFRDLDQFGLYYRN